MSRKVKVFLSLSAIVFLSFLLSTANLANAKGGNDMIMITATWKAKKGKEEELKKHLAKMVEAVRKNEPNCLQYTLHQGTEDKTRFFFYERYSSKDAIEIHKNTPHFKTLIQNTEGLVAEPVRVELLKEVQ